MERKVNSRVNRWFVPGRNNVEYGSYGSSIWASTPEMWFLSNRRYLMEDTPTLRGPIFPSRLAASTLKRTY